MSRTNRYRRDRAAGLCVRCRQPNANGQSRCAACQEIVSAEDRRRAAEAKAARLCVDCRAGLLPAAEWSHVRCVECHERNRETTDAYNTSPRGRAKHRSRMAALYAGRRERGECVAGCGQPAMASGARCEAHEQRLKLTRIAYLDRREAADAR